jgi:hypothetical protein
MKDNILTDRVKTGTQTDAASEISKVAVSAIGISAGVIGIWAVASVIAGVSSSGGPIELLNSLFKAIAG